MKKFLTIFAVIGLAFSVSVASAAEPAAFEQPVIDDGFGSSFFTATTPDALQDNDGANMMLSGADDALNDSLAEELGNIAPAAGGEDLFILPSEEEVSVNPGSEELAAPAVAPVPGMDPVQ